MKRPGTIGASAGGLGGLVFAIGQLVRLLSGGGEAVIAVGVLVLVSGSLLVTVGLAGRASSRRGWACRLASRHRCLGFEVQTAAATARPRVGRLGRPLSLGTNAWRCDADTAG